MTRGRSVEELLRELYYRDGLTLAEISDVLNVPVSTVGGWMVRLGINQRRLAGLAGLGVEKAS